MLTEPKDLSMGRMMKAENPTKHPATDSEPTEKSTMPKRKDYPDEDSFTTAQAEWWKKVESDALSD